MLALYKNALELMTKSSLKEFVNSQNKSVLKLLAEQTPVLGEVLDKGTAILGLGNTVEKLEETQAALKKFEKEYNALSPKLNKNVVTVKGGYDEAVFISGKRREVHTKSKKTELACEGEFWKKAKEGKDYRYRISALPIRGKAADQLFTMLAKDKSKRDDRKLMELVHGELDVWAGRWETFRGGVTITRTGGGLKIVPAAGDLLGRRGGKIVAEFVCESRIAGRWSIASPAMEGTFTWNLKTNQREFTGTFNEKIGAAENRRWTGRKQ